MCQKSLKQDMEGIFAKVKCIRQKKGIVFFSKKQDKCAVGGGGGGGGGGGEF